MFNRIRHKKLLAGLLVVGLVPAVFFYCRQANHPAPVLVPAKASGIAAVATAPATNKLEAPAADKPKTPATDKTELAASLPKPDNQPAPVNTNSPVPAEDAPVGFADSLMSVLSPSAKAVTMQPELQPAPKLEKRVAVQPIVRPVVRQAAKPLTTEQKRLKVAQKGFDEAMALAYNYPDAYGFLPDENLQAAKLGQPILVYTIPQEGRAHYMGQPVASMLKPADEWIFPIILNNRIRFMVQVRYDGRDYVPGQGSRALAVVYDKILARWPASEGFHPQLVINPKMPFYYFTIPELPDQNLTDTSRMLDYKPTLTPARVLLAGWR